MIRVLLVDDHPVVRRGLRAMVDELPELSAVGEAADGAEALSLLAELAESGQPRPDVVLMDLQMTGGMHGVEATRRITALPDPPAVLILTTYSTDADILTAVEAGATGYMLKDTPPDELVAAVQAAARGDGVGATGRGPVAGSSPRREADAVATGGGDPAAGRRRSAEPADLQAALHQRGHREDAPGAHLREARRGQPYGGHCRRVGRRADPADLT